jgi:hypothetical protein
MDTPTQHKMDGVFDCESPPASLGRFQDILVVAYRRVDRIGPDPFDIYLVVKEHHAVVDLWAICGQAGPRPGKIHPVRRTCPWSISIAF